MERSEIRGRPRGLRCVACVVFAHDAPRTPPLPACGRGIAYSVPANGELAGRWRHLSRRAGRGGFASGALAKRSKSGEGACPQGQTRGYAPSPGFLRCAWNPTSPRVRQGDRIWLAAWRLATRAPIRPTSPRVRGEVDLRAEPLRSEANRVRWLVHKLRLAETTRHPDFFPPLCPRGNTRT